MNRTDVKKLMQLRDIKHITRVTAIQSQKYALSYGLWIYIIKVKLSLARLLYSKNDQIIVKDLMPLMYEIQLFKNQHKSNAMPT